jgi:uncharacterized membrane protein (Fun14 family)
MSENQDPNHVETTTTIAGRNPPWKAKTVWIAAALVLIGLILWVRDATQKPAPASAPVAPGMSNLSDTKSRADSAKEDSTDLKPASPATFRLGVSYLGGFFLGWALRRFIKVTLLLSGAAIVLIGVGKKMGWINLDWALIEGHVRNSLSWLQGEGGAIKQFLSGYLPSAGAAATGVFLGFRRR